LYDFTTGEYSFNVVYEQAGSDEVVTLDYNSGDLDDFAGIELDRNAASQESDLHLIITDNQLNIDPTSEDKVIFFVGTTGSETMSFTNGTVPNAVTAGLGGYKAWSNTFGDNGKLIIDYDASSSLTNVFVDKATADDPQADKYLVFFEGGENSGMFYNTDDLYASNLEVALGAKRGTTATIDYNDSAQSFVVTNDFGVIDREEASVGVDWTAGEGRRGTLVGRELNKNTLVD
jgi:hypothetical protein